jgi:hypothetical protein
MRNYTIKYIYLLGKPKSYTMKLKVFLLCFGLLSLTYNGYAQKKKEPKSIIIDAVDIKKYHNIDELERLPKGDLLILYKERISSLVKILPNIAFATKPGVTMESLGIPKDKENTKILENQHDETLSYIEATLEFQDVMLPYSDTNKLIAAILFYEETLKALHEYDRFTE